MVRYVGFQPTFVPSKWLLDPFFRGAEVSKEVSVLGPFSVNLADRLSEFLGLKRYDFFVTGENRLPKSRIAKKQIGFWRSYSDRADVFRFPNWMWHLDWPGLEHQPPYPRYGMRLSIDRLMRPISETYSKKQVQGGIEKAALFSKHLCEPRKRFFEVTNKIIGCDGFGGAFGNDNRQQPKMPLMEQYRFSLCPENSIGDGYVTEKIPEAFHSGCIPIGWCRPEDLAEDFNPEAVVNLFGLDDHEISEVLTEISRGGAYYDSLISTPLLKERPSLAPLMEFINE